MSWWLILIAILVVLLSLLPLTTLRIRIVYQRREENDEATVTVYWLWGLIRYRWKASQIEWTKEGIDVKEKMKSNIPSPKKKLRERINLASIQRASRSWRYLQQNIVHLSNIIRFFFSRMVCEKLEWTSRLGTGDAAETGVLTGIAWGVKYGVVGLIDSHIQWKSAPYINVSPLFTEERLETDFECIVRFKVGHAIRAGVQLFLRMNKGGEGKWQNTLSKA
ncbi:DUF2953 domain-containing protein [Marininema halotolerans]|uniref:DUF2953 domain-containing protein n=1 Tax=Marininema halotolerans TaxID=1155944 RepID=A0A1I6TRL7_9BACL|nr:DUF2953 domain-containing protein [Marininema halotolerans]SFS91903.1 Protein of unknown function [Marininema halotolerans]